MWKTEWNLENSQIHEVKQYNLKLKNGSKIRIEIFYKILWGE